MKNFILTILYSISIFSSMQANLNLQVRRVLQGSVEKVEDQKSKQIKKIQINSTPLANKQEKGRFYCGKLNRGTLNQKTPQNDRKVLVSTVYGFNMYVDRKDAYGSSIIERQGYHYIDNVRQIANLVNPGNTVLNVGSQTGEQALAIAKIIGPTGKLFIVEPYWFSNDLITSSIKYNNFTDFTTIYKKGASDKKGTSVISVRFENTGFSLINDKYKNELKENEKIKTHQKGEFQQVEIDTIDNILPKDVSIDFALIDVERMQALVLGGMKEIIKRSPNIIMMVEWMNFDNNPGITRQYKKQILQYLVNNGFGIYVYPSLDQNTCKITKFNRVENLDQILNNWDLRDLFFIPLKHQLLTKIKV